MTIGTLLSIIIICHFNKLTPIPASLIIKSSYASVKTETKSLFVSSHKLNTKNFLLTVKV